MSKKIKLYDAIDFKDGKFVPVTEGIDYELNTPLKNPGCTFTPKAASQLIYQKLVELAPTINKGNDPTIATEFSKFVLLKILMQDGCEGIRFTKCKGITEHGQIDPDPNNESMVAFGIDKNGEPLKKEYFKLNPTTVLAVEQSPLTDEKGNGIKASSINLLLGTKEFTEETFYTSFYKSLI